MITSPPLDVLATAVLLLRENLHIAYLNHSAEQLLGHSSKLIREEPFFALIKGDIDENLLRKIHRQPRSTLLEDIELKTSIGVLKTNIMVGNYRFEGANYILLELQTSEHQSQIRKDIELQQQNRVSNHLLRNLAHEIKNPLGGIKGAAQLLDRKLPDDFPNKYCQIITQEAERLGYLVDRLLLPAVPEEKICTNTHLLIEQALEIVLLQLEHKPIVVKDYDPSLPDLLLSPGQIQQTLLNLIKNAAEAIEPLAERGRITLTTRIIHQHTIGKTQHRQVIRIDIIDNGSGIPAELINDIFYPTISGKNSSGLGLSIAQSIAQRHNGIIEVESTLSASTQPEKTDIDKISQAKHLLSNHLNPPPSKIQTRKSQVKTCFSLFLPVEKNHD